MTDLLGVDAATLLLAGQTIKADVREALLDITLTRTVEGAGTLDMTVHDPERRLITAKLLSERTAANIDGTVYELVQVRKSGSGLSITFEDAVVADLRKVTAALSAKAGSTTIDAFARRVVAKAPAAKLVAYAGQKNLAALAVGTAGTTVETYWDGLQRLAQERGWRCFADRGTVYLGPDSWLIGRVTPVTVREHTDGVEDIDWDADAGKKASRASFQADIARWAAPPGAAVNIVDQGLGSGIWLVSDVTRPLFQTLGTVSLVRQQPVIAEPTPPPRDDGGPSTTKSHGSSGAAVKGPISAKGFAWPLSGTLTSGFGQRNGKLHAGQDIGVPIGTPVHACADGTVSVAGPVSGYGLAVYIEHAGGMTTRYGHLSRVDVRRGQVVSRGDEIALSGNTGTSTGPHLHVEFRKAGVAVDPLLYLPARR